MENKDRILERIRKMLALAKDAGATEGERDNALRMAHATLAKHNLDIAQLEAKGEKNDDRGLLRRSFYGRPWARAVAGAVAEMCFCHHLYLSIRGSKDVVHIFVGRESNAITASELSEYLVDSIHREAKRFQTRVDGGNNTYRSFAWGAASAIAKRCRQLREAIEKESERVSTPGTGLVLYRANEAEANQALIDKAFPKIGSGRGAKPIHDYAATLSGREYGETVSLNRQVEGSKSNAFRLGRDGD